MKKFIAIILMFFSFSAFAEDIEDISKMDVNYIMKKDYFFNKGHIKEVHQTTKGKIVRVDYLRNVHGGNFEDLIAVFFYDKSDNIEGIMVFLGFDSDCYGENIYKETCANIAKKNFNYKEWVNAELNGKDYIETSYFSGTTIRNLGYDSKGVGLYRCSLVPFGDYYPKHNPEEIIKFKTIIDLDEYMKGLYL